MRELAGRVAIVTGGASGIGRGMALAFAEAGMDVVVADIDEALAQTVAEEIRALGSRVLTQRVDVAKREVIDYVLVGKRAWGLGLSASEETLFGSLVRKVW